MPSARATDLIRVEVNRGEDDDTHPVFETALYFSPNYQPLVIKGQYKVYKSLYDKMLIKQSDIYSIVTAEFPAKVKKSTKLLKGFQMNEKDLEQRCKLLNLWMQDLIGNFNVLSIGIQEMILVFFCLKPSDL